jgi:hypothetical protein
VGEKQSVTLGQAIPERGNNLVETGAGGKKELELTTSR